jgi:type IV pilus assembly protein PilA
MPYLRLRARGACLRGNLKWRSTVHRVNLAHLTAVLCPRQGDNCTFQSASCAREAFPWWEVLVVVVVILVIAAIAIPSMLRARVKANEAAAIANMRTINTAESMYYNNYPDVGYAGSLADLGSHGSNCETPGKTNACLVMDEELVSGLKSGYVFDLVGDGQAPTQGYTLTALPEASSTTGRCSFTSNQMGAIRAKSSGGGGKFSLSGNTCDQSVSVAPAP